jgi:hypothetical protein
VIGGTRNRLSCHEGAGTDCVGSGAPYRLLAKTQQNRAPPIVTHMIDPDLAIHACVESWTLPHNV